MFGADGAWEVENLCIFFLVTTSENCNLVIFFPLINTNFALSGASRLKKTPTLENLGKTILNSRDDVPSSFACYEKFSENLGGYINISLSKHASSSSTSISRNKKNI